MSSLQQPFFRDSEATVTKIMNYGCCCCSCRCYPTFHVGKVAGVQDCCSSSRSNPFFILIIMTAWMLKCVWAAPNQPLYKFIASRSGDCGILCCSVSSCDGFWSSKAAKELVGQQKQPRPGVKHAATTQPAVRMPRASNFLLKMIEEVVVIYLKRTSLAASAKLNYTSWHAIISYATYAEEEQYGQSWSNAFIAMRAASITTLIMKLASFFTEKPRWKKSIFSSIRGSDIWKWLNYPLYITKTFQ